MTLDDLIVAAGIVVAVIVFAIGRMVRTARRMRPQGASPPAPPRRIAVPPPRGRVPGPTAPPKRAAVAKRPPAPTLEARLFGNRRLSTGARLVLASEILSRPKALRRGRPF